MFLGASVQQFTLAILAERLQWLFAIFGVMSSAGAAILAFISPENTFAAIADILGFLFLIVGIFWIIEAFAAKVNPLWWLGLVAGILMVALAFYTGGQFFIDKAYVLLVRGHLGPHERDHRHHACLPAPPLSGALV